jgi:hypothetical protein
VTKQNPTYEELVDFARWTQTFWKNGIEIMRKNGLVIKSDEPMEKLAFTFYSDLCEIDVKASHLFEEGFGDQNYKHESAIQFQTIKAYPKPYEEKIRHDEREKVLIEAHSKLSGLLTKDKWVDEFVWWKVIKIALKELHKGEEE